MKDKSIMHQSFLILCLAFLPWFSFAQNPVIEDIGMSDPHVRVFNDTLYLYTGHDDDPDDRTWVMKDWMIFSSTDLVDWQRVGTISPENNYMDDNSTDCWAGDAIGRNGQYYFYFSDRKRGIGVMESPRPEGPFQDPLGKPLVSPMHDPTVLIDDDPDKTPYLVYGHKEHGESYRVARLNGDMISLAEEPRIIEINGEGWEKAPEWMDKNYIFKHKGTYYLSWGADYAVSQDVYGPYTWVGRVGEGYKLGPYAHGSFFEWKGQFYHVWCHYLRSGYKYRESIMTYCHRIDGRIYTDTDFLDLHFNYGVGRYHSSWPTIEGEWFYESSKGISKKLKPKEERKFVVESNRSGSWIRFAKVEGDTPREIAGANLAFTDTGTLEIRLNNPDGPRLGVFDLSSKYADGQFHTLWVELKNDDWWKQEQDIYLVFQGAAADSLQLDWIRFTER